MRFATLALALGLTTFATAGSAYEQLGYGRLITNDLIGDGGDRWQTGAYAASYAFGRSSWEGTLPSAPGQILEFRLQAAMASPASLRAPEAGDRPLTGRVRFGLGSQFLMGGFETDLGGYLDFVGRETGLVDFQTGLHELLPGAPAPSKEVRDNQLDLDPTLGASVELARTLSVGSVALRPFIAAEAGHETFTRAGLDLTLGTFGRGGMQTRDPVTGHRYRVLHGEGAGLSLVMGADVTQIHDTQLLREKDGVEAVDERQRLRAGVHYQAARGNYFYGLTYLSPETEFQDGEGQVTGSIRIDWQF